MIGVYFFSLLMLCQLATFPVTCTMPAEQETNLGAAMVEDCWTIKHLLQEAQIALETPYLDLICLHTDQATVLTGMRAIEEILNALPKMQLTEEKIRLIEERFKEHYLMLSAHDMTRAVQNRTSKTFRNIDVERNANIRSLAVAGNAVIVRNLTVGGNQTIDGNLTVTGKINGSSGGGSTGNFVVNGGQTGPVTVGTTDATGLTFITDSFTGLTIDQSGNTTIQGITTLNSSLALPGLPSGSGSTTLFIDTTTGAVTSGPASGGGDVFKGGQPGPFTIGTNNNTPFSLEANNHASLVINNTGEVTMPGLSTADSLSISGSSTGSALVVTASSSTSQPTVVVNSVSGGTGTGLNVDASPAASGIGLNVVGNAASPAVHITAGSGQTPLQLSGLANGDLAQDFVLLVDGSGNALQTASSASQTFLINGGQTGNVTIGTLDGNALQSVTNSTTRMTINSAGQITVNAPDSGNALSVTSGAGTANAAAFLQQGATSTGSALVARSGNNASGPVVQVLGNAAGTGISIDMTTGTGTGLMVSGNNANPAATLQAGTGQTPLQLVGLSDGNITTDVPLLLDGSNNVVKSNASLTGIFVVNGGQVGAVTVGTTSADSLDLVTNNATRMSIDNAGKVVINAPDSGTAFSVTGSASASPAVSITQGASSHNALLVTAADAATAPAVAVAGAANASDIMDVVGTTGGTGVGLSVNVSAATSGIGLAITGNTGSAAVQINSGTGQNPLVLPTLQQGDTTNAMLLVDGSGNVLRTSGSANSTFVLNGGQTGTVTVGTTDGNALDLVTGTNGPNTRIAIAGAGNVNINAPTSGDTLTLGQITGGTALAVTADGNTFGINVDASAGTGIGLQVLGNATNFATQIINNNGGGLFVQAPNGASAVDVDASNGSTTVGLRVFGGDTAPAVTIFTNGGPTLQLNGLQPGSGTALLLDATNNVVLSTSTKRFKENFRTLEDASGIYKLKPTIFDFKPENGGEKDQIGFIAEEVKEIFPTMINHDKEGNVQSIRYDCFHALLVKELQEHRKLLDAYEQRLQQQEQLLATLMKK